jgi:predicted transposase/invertase (TIGR01784 family)
MNTISNTFNRSSEPELICFDWLVLLGIEANAVLEGFLSVVLNEEVKIISIKGGVNAANEYRSDMMVENKNGELFIIELHSCEIADYYLKMVRPLLKATIDHVMNGEPYSKIRKVYHIKIANFEFGTGIDYVYRGATELRGIHCNDVLQLTERQKFFLSAGHKKDVYEMMGVTPEYFILCVENFNKVAENNLDQWMYYLKNNTIPDEFQAPGLKEARRQLKYDNLSEQEKMDYIHHVKQNRYEQNSIDTAKLEGEIIGLEKGEAIGLEKGLEKGRADAEAKLESVVIKSRLAGLSVEIISNITGLTPEQITEILRRHSLI